MYPSLRNATSSRTWPTVQGQSMRLVLAGADFCSSLHLMAYLHRVDHKQVIQNKCCRGLLSWKRDFGHFLQELYKDCRGSMLGTREASTAAGFHVHHWLALSFCRENYGNLPK